jgi:hypothetical protein
MRPESERVQQKTIQTKGTIMNKDASEFSLEKIWSTIKPHAEDLPFKRLRNFTEHHSPGRSKQIRGVVYYFKLWAKKTDIPSDIETKVKAYSFTLGNEITYHPGKEERSTPLSVKFKDLVLVSEAKETCRWLFQTSEFTPDYSLNPEGYYFRGKSKLVWIEDENFMKLFIPHKGFSADLWNQVREWARGSIEEREKINKKLKELEEHSVNEVLKFAKE